VPTVISRSAGDVARFIATDAGYAKALRASRASPPSLWKFESDNPVKTAGYLIDQAGTVEAAQTALDMAAMQRRKPQGRPRSNDWPMILRAHTIRKNTGCSATKAYRQAAAEFGNGPAAVENAVRRMRDTVKKVRKTRRKAKV
jgi:hypothetical protein